MRGLSLVIHIACLVACGFPRPADVPGDDDAGRSGLPGAGACFGNFLKICLAEAPTMPFTISTAANVNTDSPLCASVVSGGAGYCVIAATDITINATLRATGTRPLVLIASGSIVTTALIDVSSNRTPDRALGIGAGGDPSVCAPGIRPVGRGGNAGGSFIGLGGSGGFGSDGSTGGTPGATMTDVTELRGGCPGQNGFNLDEGGYGGGAVFLIAGKRIDVQGGINASGAGGFGSSGGANPGYGGGSGGMIGFEAPMITCSSLLLASGGGGGGGSTGAFEGGNGQDPATTDPALGGLGANGGTGGNGSMAARAAPGLAGGPGNPAGEVAGGGGGGGGAGLIKAPASAQLGTNVSPPPTP